MVEGTWHAVSGELGGQPFPDAVVKTIQLTVKDGHYTVLVGEQEDEGTVVFVPDTTPRALDITGVAGPNAGKTIPAIYEVSGESLRICYNLGGPERTTTFTTAAGTQQFLVTYARGEMP